MNIFIGKIQRRHSCHSRLSLRESSGKQRLLSLRESCVNQRRLSLRESSPLSRYFRGAKGDCIRVTFAERKATIVCDFGLVFGVLLSGVLALQLGD